MIIILLLKFQNDPVKYLFDLSRQQPLKWAILTNSGADNSTFLEQISLKFELDLCLYVIFL